MASERLVSPGVTKVAVSLASSGNGYLASAGAAGCWAFGPVFLAAVLRIIRAGTKPTSPCASSGAGTRGTLRPRSCVAYSGRKLPPPPP